MLRVARMICCCTMMAAAACGSSGTDAGVVTPPPPLPPADRSVTATPSLTFTPASLTVAAGDTVSFAFQSVAHNVFFDTNGGAPADIQGSNANTTITRVFAAAGSYRYTCHIHPFMVGTVVVR